MQQRSAAGTQAGAAQAGIDNSGRQFDAIQKLLQLRHSRYTSPWWALRSCWRNQHLKQQQALLGLRGPEAERALIERIRGGETFQTLARQGEEALLQRASATGGLRVVMYKRHWLSLDQHCFLTLLNNNMVGRLVE
jgi:hypothetical protein